MSESLKKAVKESCQACNNDPMRMMDIVREVEAKFDCVSNEAMDLIAETVNPTDTPDQPYLYPY